MSDTKALMSYEFGNSSVRVEMIDGEPWFVARDVCSVLGIENVGNAVSRLDDDEKGIQSLDTLGGNQNMTIINESGLYSLILRSNKPEAKVFKRWVTKEVLPSIRKTGGYGKVDTSREDKLNMQNSDNGIEKLLYQTSKALEVTANTQLLILQGNNEKEQKRFTCDDKISLVHDEVKSLRKKVNELESKIQSAGFDELITEAIQSSRRRFTDLEDAKIMFLRDKGVIMSSIAYILDRSELAIKTRIKILRDRRKAEAEDE